MPMRQVIVIDPVTGTSRHTYIDLGPGAAKPNHGQPTGQRYTARGLGNVITPKAKFTQRESGKS